MSKETYLKRQRVREELQRIADQHDGRLKPEWVVDAARPEDSPLHDYFTWDDTLAAEERRKDQARPLIRSVEIRYREETVRLSCPKYVRDPAAGPMETGYIEAARVKGNDDLAREVLVDEFKRAGAALGRARKVAKFLNMDAEIDSFIDRLELMKSTVEVGHG